MQGTALKPNGAFVMSPDIGEHTGFWVMLGNYMFVFGVGLGMVMQVLVVAVQNAVPYEDLGVATSSATFFRMIGGSFGTAVFGAIFANVLRGKVAWLWSLVALQRARMSRPGRSRPTCRRSILRCWRL